MTNRFHTWFATLRVFSTWFGTRSRSLSPSGGAWWVARAQWTHTFDPFVGETRQSSVARALRGNRT